MTTNLPPNTSYDPFDPNSLRVESMAAASVEKVLTAVPVRKPKRTEFFRVHPEHVLDTYVLEWDSESGMGKDSYLVMPEAQDLVRDELRHTRLLVAMNRQGTPFLWPIKLPGGDNDRIHRIADTALQAADLAKTRWVRMVWNSNLGAYDIHRATGDLGDPQWPERSFRDLIEIAFRNNLISGPDHPVIKALSGDL